MEACQQIDNEFNYKKNGNPLSRADHQDDGIVYTKNC